MDAFPRAQVDLLKALAGHIAVAVDNAQRNQEGARGQVQHIRDEQEEARRIQQSLLPRSAPLLPGFRLETDWVPAGAVGGDWYDFMPLTDGRVAIVLDNASAYF